LGVRTYIDSGVLIAAIRGDQTIAAAARSYLYDPLRDYISSDYVKVEVLPSCIFQGNQDEKDFYDDFFRRTITRVPSDDALLQLAINEGSATGVSGLDAVHVACARVGGAVDLITSEKVTKPIHRAAGINVISINPERAARSELQRSAIALGRASKSFAIAILRSIKKALRLGS